MRLGPEDAKSIKMINDFTDLGFQVAIWPDRLNDRYEVRLYSGEWTTGYQRLPRLVKGHGSSMYRALQIADESLKKLMAER